MKAIEDWAGAKLFTRQAQGVELNDLGRAVLPQLSEAFDQLGAASQSLRRLAAPKAVRIAALPAVAQLWLSPRMPALRAAFPEMRFSITAQEMLPSLVRDPFDLALFFTAHKDPGTRRIELARDRLFPVAAPVLASGLESPGDLDPALMLQDLAWAGDWRCWLDRCAPETKLSPAGPAYSLYSLALEETRQGAGILIGHEALVAPFLEDGSLVAPFEGRAETGLPLTLHLGEGLPQGDPLLEVVGWLRDAGWHPTG